MAGKVQFKGGREGERFLENFEQDFLRLGFLRFFVHDTDDTSLKDDTMYSYTHLPVEDVKSVKSLSDKCMWVNLDILKKPLEQGKWAGCMDTKNFPLGDIVFFCGDKHYASYFFERNILFTCDLAHAWEVETNSADERQKISTEVWKIITSTISEFKNKAQTANKPTSRVALVLENWGRPV